MGNGTESGAARAPEGAPGGAARRNRVGWRVTAALALALAAAGLYAEQRGHEGRRITLTTAAEAAAAPFRPAPIPPDWIVEGDPVAEAAEVSRTHDGSAQVFVWRTTAGTFRWTHAVDEIVTILDGAAFVTDADGRTWHLKAGDVAHFPAGAAQTWRVPDRVMKTAVLKSAMPAPVAAALRWLRRARDLVAPAARLG